MSVWNKSIPIHNLLHEMIIKGSLVNPEDGDLKLGVGENGVTTVYEYSTEAMEWIPSSLRLGSASLEVGPQITVTDAGNILAHTRKHDPDTYLTNPFSEFGVGGGIRPMTALRLVGDPEYKYSSGDGTTEWPGILSGGKYKHIDSAPNFVPFLGWRQYAKLGSVPPTAPLKVTIYIDSIAVENIITDMTLPVSFWDGKSAGDEFDYYFSAKFNGRKTPLVSIVGQTYITVFESDGPWSIRGDEDRVYLGIEGQHYEFDLIMIDNPVVVSSDISHTVQSDYYVDTESGEVTIKIPYGNKASMTVHDAKKEFKNNSCFVEVLDSVGAVAHSLELDKKNEAWWIFFDGVNWNYSEVGKGEVVAIASAHVASVDMPAVAVAPSCSEIAGEEHVGKVRYEATANTSCIEMCMKTGASSYSWVCIKENTW